MEFFEWVKKQGRWQKQSNIVDVVVDQYRKPYRQYHNLEHLDNVLSTARAIDAPEIVQNALVFHDIVYTPGAPAGQNEVASIAFARPYLVQLRYNELEIQQIQKLIMATVFHIHSSGSQITLEDYMIDCDLAGFADNFNENTQRLFAEFVPAVCNERDFWAGRAKFLAGRLMLPQVFKILKDFEAKARSNLALGIAECVDKLK